MKKLNFILLAFFIFLFNACENDNLSGGTNKVQDSFSSKIAML